MKSEYFTALVAQATDSLLNKMIEEAELNDDEFDAVSKELTSRHLDAYERIHNL